MKSFLQMLLAGFGVLTLMLAGCSSTGTEDVVEEEDVVVEDAVVVEEGDVVEEGEMMEEEDSSVGE